ncbi:hypothetical protein PV11_08653 [Exophiala sideris]|uniref:Transcription factor domain-containing protein n=1 Tax=Exophiala sideris TaxID=1016849 RepID=A0A0D1X174_9EURO|nr:hypothetical protein PV11_08653 [Exophiala sideris]
MSDGGFFAAVHSENRYASGRERRPRGPRSSLKEHAVTELDRPVSGDLADLKTQAILYYMHHYLKAPKETPKDLKAHSVDFLTAWVGKTDDPILHPAVSCMALAIFSRTKKCQPAAVQASMTYHRLLQHARVSIPSLVAANVDVWLLAVFFMARYEDAVFDPSRPRSFRMAAGSFFHHDGASTILKFWKEQQSVDHQATDIMRYSRRGLLRSAVMRRLAVPEWLLDGSDYCERGLELEYDRILVRLVNLRHRIFETGNQPVVDELTKEACDIDKAARQWSSHFPSTWCYKQYTVADHENFPTQHLFSPTVYHYSSLAHAAVWNQYYTIRMLALSTRLRVEESQAERAECLSCLKSMASHFTSSLPFCLGRFQLADESCGACSIQLTTKGPVKPYLASLTVWPMFLASSLENVELEQIPWLRATLADLGRTMGYGVIEHAKNEQWLRI